MPGTLTGVTPVYEQYAAGTTRYQTDRNNFAPRLGFAWSATPETVVRGSYGIYYNLSALAPSEGLYFSDP